MIFSQIIEFMPLKYDLCNTFVTIIDQKGPDNEECVRNYSTIPIT
jgi:hypothetical protein